MGRERFKILFSAIILCLTSTALAEVPQVFRGEELVIFSGGFEAQGSSSFAFPGQKHSIVGRPAAGISVVRSDVVPAGFSAPQLGERMDVTQSLLNQCDQIEALNPGVVCEPNYLYSINAASTPTDTYYSSLWGLEKINVQTAWNTTTGSSSVIAAVIDTGIDYTHDDLTANMWVNTGEIAGNGLDDDGNGYIDDVYGYDFANGDGNPYDGHSHGTHVAGTIGARANGFGVVGVNQNVKLMAVKVLLDSGSGSLSAVAAGIVYAAQNGASVINLSLGGPSGSTTLLNALETARDAGVLVACAAGNDSADNDVSGSYPANYNLANMISVASTTSSDGLSSFSNYGDNSVHLGAPGSSIISSVPGDSYASYSGTSMATPHVAGAAALLKAAKPSATATQIKDAILNSVDALSSLNGKTITGGRLNLAAAVTAINGDDEDDDEDDDEEIENPSVPGTGPGGETDTPTLSAFKNRRTGNLARIYALYSLSVTPIDGLNFRMTCQRGVYSAEYTGTTDEDGFAQQRIRRHRTKNLTCTVEAYVDSIFYTARLSVLSRAGARLARFARRAGRSRS